MSSPRRPSTSLGLVRELLQSGARSPLRPCVPSSLARMGRVWPMARMPHGPATASLSSLEAAGRSHAAGRQRLGSGSHLVGRAHIKRVRGAGGQAFDYGCLRDRGPTDYHHLGDLRSRVDPSQAGADQPTVASPGPGTAPTPVGGSGTSGETGPVTPMTLKYAAP